uniref:uncharacterized protein LOC122587840 n=1 Tax=Erigeron canadensis TaxID=72917 RepID=UPI001CB90F6D|nr:uncharacterized protein LOC122587840 [Erigeron canadensis]
MATWETYGIDDTHYEVDDRKHRYVVHLDNQTCGCRKWQLSGLPCGHAIAVSRFLKQSNYLSFAKEWFHKPVYQATYRESIFPVGDTDDWEILEDVEPLFPPLMEKRQAGRPKNKDRIPSQGEVPIKKGCTRCGEFGHKRSQFQSPFPSQSKPPRSGSQSENNDALDLDDM